ncbi:putative interleukin 2 receptor, gamma chain domain-containing protein [Phthorimaea operculella]|nr:putative interleukin 2 receptor, gamma chain domain-containing protein [Phthorimaea operculella]
MFIFVMYKDPPELSTFRRSFSFDDISQEKTLLVNPKCPVRVMLEFIRKQCKLAGQTYFDLCDDSGNLKGLFYFPTYSCADVHFDHKKTYYLIVLSKSPADGDLKSILVFPQVSCDSKLYGDLQAKVRRCLTGDVHEKPSPEKTTPSSKKKSPESKA